MKYKIPATWSVSAMISVEADNLAEAIQKAEKASLDKFVDKEYIDGSYETNMSFIPSLNKNLSVEELQSLSPNE